MLPPLANSSRRKTTGAHRSEGRREGRRGNDDLYPSCRRLPSRSIPARFWFMSRDEYEAWVYLAGIHGDWRCMYFEFLMDSR
jgi:hypothetical protein